MTRIIAWILVIFPIIVLVIAAFASVGFVLLFGWLFSLVTGLTLWQAVVITSTAFALATHTLHQRLPYKNDVFPILIFAPMITFLFLLIIWPLELLLIRVTPFDAWAAGLVSAAMTLTVGYVSTSWITGQATDLFIETEQPYSRIKATDEEEFEEYMEQYEEGCYLLVRDRNTEELLFLSIDEIALDEPCPCGSGRKFRNCHGQGQTQRRRR